MAREGEQRLQTPAESTAVVVILSDSLYSML